MKITGNDIAKTLLAGICGIVGFAVAYWALGFIFEPIEKYLDKKLEGGK